MGGWGPERQPLPKKAADPHCRDLGTAPSHPFVQGRTRSPQPPLLQGTQVGGDPWGETATHPAAEGSPCRPLCCPCSRGPGPCTEGQDPCDPTRSLRLPQGRGGTWGQVPKCFSVACSGMLASARPRNPNPSPEPIPKPSCPRGRPGLSLIPDPCCLHSLAPKDTAGTPVGPWPWAARDRDGAAWLPCSFPLVSRAGQAQRGNRPGYAHLGRHAPPATPGRCYTYLNDNHSDSLIINVSLPL